ncbi:DUF2312 domain-containing protein [Salinarimonas soli]|uniref:DUF2312 domain-containing protein n=1 Tax=Salinarimonas soli TaxID=1638099 RepID=A0A5B2VTQ6_9HYPH|nr:DUF2312 domain-containing protein [Salinarimonas soli]
MGKLLRVPEAELGATPALDLSWRPKGFDTKVLRRIVAMRKRDQAECQEDGTLELYLQALGMA